MYLGFCCALALCFSLCISVLAKYSALEVTYVLLNDS